MSELPHLIGEFPWRSVDGVPLDADVCLVIRTAERFEGAFGFASGDGGVSGAIPWQLTRAE